MRRKKELQALKDRVELLELLVEEWDMEFNGARIVEKLVQHQQRNGPLPFRTTA